MVKSYLKMAVAILAFIVVTAAPQKSISQKQNQAPAGTDNTGIGAEAPGGRSLDDLKMIREAVVNADDLAEDVKKGLLSFVDRAIIFREREAQLRKETEDIRQRVKAAPERIKAIEAELDRPLPAPEDVVTIAATMKPDQIAEQLINEWYGASK